MNRLYYIKKAFLLFPGIVQPVSAIALRPHYDHRTKLRGPVRVGIDMLVGVLFTMWLVLRTRQIGRRHGKSAAWRKGALSIARERFADPSDIALFRIHSADQFDDIIRRYEDAGLNKQINPMAWRPGCALADKKLFADRCQRHDLPHPRARAIFDRGHVEILSLPGLEPLFAKPVSGEGGDNAGPLGTFGGQHEESDFASWIRMHLADVSDPMLIQDLACVHSDIADITLDALPTIRICTFLNEKGVAEAVHAVFRFAAERGIAVDNMKAGGLLAGIELHVGRLYSARFGKGDEDFTEHPATGAAISGRQMPEWKETIELAERAHNHAFPHYRLIGWDIAPSTNGPILIEGNAKPSMKLLQRGGPNGPRGLANQRYGELLAYHLMATRRTAAL